MNAYERKLRRFMEDHRVEGEHLLFDRSCHSVAEAAEAAGAAPEDFVKSICMVDAEGSLIVAIVKGEDRASTSRVGKALQIHRPRLATAEEALEKTGYPIGGTPAFAYEATFLVDPKVLEKDAVYAGGGSENALVQIPSRELLRANRGEVVRVRK